MGWPAAVLVGMAVALATYIVASVVLLAKHWDVHCDDDGHVRVTIATTAALCLVPLGYVIATLVASSQRGKCWAVGAGLSLLSLAGLAACNLAMAFSAEPDPSGCSNGFRALLELRVAFRVAWTVVMLVSIVVSCLRGLLMPSSRETALADLNADADADVMVRTHSSSSSG